MLSKSGRVEENFEFNGLVKSSVLLSDPLTIHEMRCVFRFLEKLHDFRIAYRDLSPIEDEDEKEDEDD